MMIMKNKYLITLLSIILVLTLQSVYGGTDCFGTKYSPQCGLYCSVDSSSATCSVTYTGSKFGDLGSLGYKQYELVKNANQLFRCDRQCQSDFYGGSGIDTDGRLDFSCTDQCCMVCSGKGLPLVCKNDCSGTHCNSRSCTSQINDLYIIECYRDNDCAGFSWCDKRSSNPANWRCKPCLDTYFNNAEAYSKSFYPQYDTEYVDTMTVSKLDTTPATTDIGYEYSVDDGNTWAPIPVFDAPYTPPTLGAELKWRALLSTTDDVFRPSIDDITIDYRIRRDAITYIEENVVSKEYYIAEVITPQDTYDKSRYYMENISELQPDGSYGGPDSYFFISLTGNYWFDMPVPCSTECGGIDGIHCYANGSMCYNCMYFLESDMNRRACEVSSLEDGCSGKTFEWDADGSIEGQDTFDGDPEDDMCCGDEGGEVSLITCTGECIGDSTDACCGATTDCVYNNTCYPYDPNDMDSTDTGSDSCIIDNLWKGYCDSRSQWAEPEDSKDSCCCLSSGYWDTLQGCCDVGEFWGSSDGSFTCLEGQVYGTYTGDMCDHTSFDNPPQDPVTTPGVCDLEIFEGNDYYWSLNFTLLVRDSDNSEDACCCLASGYYNDTGGCCDIGDSWMVTSLICENGVITGKYDTFCDAAYGNTPNPASREPALCELVNFGGTDYYWDGNEFVTSQPLGCPCTTDAECSAIIATARCDNEPEIGAGAYPVTGTDMDVCYDPASCYTAGGNCNTQYPGPALKCEVDQADGPANEICDDTIEEEICYDPGICDECIWHPDHDESEYYCTTTATNCIPYDWDADGSDEGSDGHDGDTLDDLCCGDDPNEFYITCTNHHLCIDPDDGCCNDANDCVYLDTCYTSDADDTDYTDTDSDSCLYKDAFKGFCSQPDGWVNVSDNSSDACCCLSTGYWDDTFGNGCCDIGDTWVTPDYVCQNGVITGDYTNPECSDFDKNYTKIVIPTKCSVKIEDDGTKKYWDGSNWVDFSPPGCTCTLDSDCLSGKCIAGNCVSGETFRISGIKTDYTIDYDGRSMIFFNAENLLNDAMDINLRIVPQAGSEDFQYQSYLLGKKVTPPRLEDTIKLQPHEVKIISLVVEPLENLVSYDIDIISTNSWSTITNTTRIDIAIDRDDIKTLSEIATPGLSTALVIILTLTSIVLISIRLNKKKK